MSRRDDAPALAAPIPSNTLPSLAPFRLTTVCCARMGQPHKTRIVRITAQVPLRLFVWSEPNLNRISFSLLFRHSGFRSRSLPVRVSHVSEEKTRAPQQRFRALSANWFLCGGDCAAFMHQRCPAFSPKDAHKARRSCAPEWFASCSRTCLRSFSDAATWPSP